MKNITLAVWALTTSLMIWEAMYGDRSMRMFLRIAIVFMMPLHLFGYLAGAAIAAPLRAGLIMLQLPFAVFIMLRSMMPLVTFASFVILYCLASGFIVFRIRKVDPGSFKK
jgi:hypothetical protein